MNFQQEYDYVIKLLLIGNTAVGKSSILLRFSENQFNENFLPTIGVDFKIKTFDIQNKKVKVQIWDTAGQERFKNITTSYYKGAHGVLIVFDISNRKSFSEIENWLQEIDKHANQEITKILVGNKCDLIDQRVVSTSEGLKFATEHQMSYIETSAKESENIEKIFFTLAEEIKTKIEKYELNVKGGKQTKLKQGIQISSNSSDNQQKNGNFQNDKKGCC